jgi:hypothetical protein
MPGMWVEGADLLAGAFLPWEWGGEGRGLGAAADKGGGGAAPAAGSGTPPCGGGGAVRRHGGGRRCRAHRPHPTDFIVAYLSAVCLYRVQSALVANQAVYPPCPSPSPVSDRKWSYRCVFLSAHLPAHGPGGCRAGGGGVHRESEVLRSLRVGSWGWLGLLRLLGRWGRFGGAFCQLAGLLGICWLAQSLQQATWTAGGAGGWVVQKK